MTLSLILVGIAVGCVSAILGIGGGVFLVPLLPVISGWSAHQTVAVSLFVIMGNALFNLWKFHKQQLVSWEVLLIWGPAAGVGSFFGSYLALLSSGITLRLVLLLVVGVMFVKTNWSYFVKSPQTVKKTPWSIKKGLWGSLVGVLSGFAGVGTGLISNILFISLGWVPNHKVAPTGNGVMFFVGFFSVISFLLFGGEHSLDFSFFKKSFFELSVLMCAVLLSSHVFRPLNSKLSQNARFIMLNGILLLVFCYVLVGIFLSGK